MTLQYPLCESDLFKWLKVDFFLGHSCFRVIHWETIITKVHSQTLMAMKSGCKMYTHKCYVTLEWPLMLHTTN